MPMSGSSKTVIVYQPIRIARFLGFFVYATAFVLPACRDSVANGVRTPDTYKGWFCALITLSNSLSPEAWHSKDLLAVLSGWINPLILIYLVLLIWPRFVWPRRIVAAVIVAFMLATWIYFGLVPLVPLIGHFLWIAGALMMLAGEVFGPNRVHAADYKL